MVATFIGHSNCNISIEEVKVEIRKMIKCGARRFLNGGMGAFDGLCARAVFELKSEFEGIESLLIIPYLNFKCSFAELFDGSIYPEGLERYYFKAAIVKRNEYMVESADMALCYVYAIGGAAKTYKRAKEKGIMLYHLCKPINTDLFN